MEKYFEKSEIMLLRRTVRDRADLAVVRKNKGAIKEWMAIDLLTSTGMRVFEVADLRCCDIDTKYGNSRVYIFNGKSSKAGRYVVIPQSLKTHLNNFLKWKKRNGEGTDEYDPVFAGQRGQWTRQAVQLIVKKYLKQLGLYQRGKSAHALRHSYAMELLRKGNAPKAVQKQLGHSSIQTTEIYIKMLPGNINDQLKGIWSAWE